MGKIFSKRVVIIFTKIESIYCTLYNLKIAKKTAADDLRRLDPTRRYRESRLYAGQTRDWEVSKKQRLKERGLGEREILVNLINMVTIIGSPVNPLGKRFYI